MAPDAQKNAVVIQLPGTFDGSVKVPGKTKRVSTKFRARVIRARSPEEGEPEPASSGSESVTLERQGEGHVPTPSTIKEVERHDWRALHTNLIKPPYNPLKLIQLEEVSNVLRECIDAMATNIEGFGFVFRRREMSEGFEEKNREAIERERRFLISRFQFICLDISFTECRKRTRRSQEGTGNGYWEVVRDTDDLPIQILQLPSYHIAIGKIDEEFTPFNQKIVDPETFEIVDIPRQKRFRRFAQVDHTGRVIVWLKEFNDPRQINRRTGEVHDPDEIVDNETGDTAGDLDPELRANELFHFKIHSDRTPYGIPRWIGRLIGILSNRKAEEVNFFTIDTQIPSLIVMVENGQLSEESIDRLTELVETQVSMSPNRTAFVILEAENAEGPAILPGQPGAPKIAVKELHNSQISEELYSRLDENNQKKVIRSFRLPQLFVGREEGLTKANGVVSRQLANEQVFAPERMEEDWQMMRILLEMGARFHVFKTKSPNITDNAELIRLMAVAEKSGAMSPRRADLIVMDVLEMALGPLPQGIDPDVPFMIQFAQAQNAMLEPGGNNETETNRSVDWFDLYLSRLLGEDEEEF